MMNNNDVFKDFFRWICGLIEMVMPLTSNTKQLILEGHVAYVRSSMYCHMSDELKGVLHFLNQNLDKMGLVRHVEAINVGNEEVYTMALNVPIQKSCVDIGNGMHARIHKYKEEVKSDYGVMVNVHIMLTLSTAKLSYTDMHTFLRRCAERYKQYVHNKSNSQMIFEYRCNDDNDKPVFDSVPFSSNTTFDTLFFEGKEEITERILDFESKEGKDRSARIGMQHALGFLFHGPPGCGKTSAIKAIANITKRHVIIIRMDRIIRHNSDSCIEVLKTILQSSTVGELEIAQDKRLWVFEEVDCWQQVIKARATQCMRKPQGKQESKDSTSALIDALQQVSSFRPPENEVSQLGGLLELLDGIIEAHGRMIVMTTNHPEAMDEALIRPGRIDICHEFKRLSRQHVCDVYKLWYGVQFPCEKIELIPDGHFTQAEVAQLFSTRNAEAASNAILKEKK